MQARDALLKSLPDGLIPRIAPEDIQSLAVYPMAIIDGMRQIFRWVRHDRKTRPSEGCKQCRASFPVTIEGDVIAAQI